MAVHCEGMSFAYGPDMVILRDINLNISPGEICGIVGASGSGKSTLLRILAGLLPTLPKQTLWGDVRVGAVSASEAREAGAIGFVFQDLKLLPYRSVRDNMLWAERRLRGRSPSGLGVDEALALVGLSEFAQAPPKQLSGGMKARLAVARALLGAPSLLLLDEAFGSLDIGWRLHLHQELAQLRNRLGLTIAMISHDLEEIAQLADRIVVLSSQGAVAGVIADMPAAERIAEMSKLILADHPARMGAV